MANKNKRKKSGSRSAAAAKTQATKAQAAKAKDDSRKRWMTIAIVVLAALMALSILLPSLTAIFAGNTQQEESTQASTDSASTQAATTTSGMDTVDSEYSALVKDLEAKLNDNPENLAAILNLGNDYMGWASAASAYATDDTGTSHVKELYGKAIEYFDKYLELEDSKDVHVRRALCQYYQGDTDNAVKALEDFTGKDGAEYGPAWAYLGVMYRYSSDTEKAEAAFNKAIEVDANDEYGAKTMANQQLASMKSGSTASTQSLAGALSNSTTSGN